MRNEAPALLPIFRSQRQADLLSWLYLRATTEYTLTELAGHLRTKPGALHAEVQRLVTAGLVSDRKVGRSRLLRANTNSRLSRPLTELLLLTFGPEVVIADEFGSVRGAEQVVIYGSWARRYRGESGVEPGDIDVMVVGSPNRDDVYDAAERAEARLKLPVSTTVRSPMAWAEGSDPLVITARAAHVVVIGDEGA